MKERRLERRNEGGNERRKRIILNLEKEGTTKKYRLNIMESLS